jgi:sigma-B regulation protein RsbU (phosphoserine phosphatase)
MLAKEDSKEASGEILGLMQKSVARMSALIDNVLDFARGRLGGGIALKRSPQSLEPVLDHVTAELRASSPGRKIEARFDLTQPVDCDGGRIGQLLSNLLGNSIAHGTAASPIRVRATTQDGEFQLSVSNFGRSDPVRSNAPVSAFLPRFLARLPARPGIGALHRLRNRACPWRNDQRDVVAGRDPLYVPDAASLTSRSARLASAGDNAIWLV